MKADQYAYEGGDHLMMVVSPADGRMAGWRVPPLTTIPDGGQQTIADTARMVGWTDGRMGGVTCHGTPRLPGMVVSMTSPAWPAGRITGRRRWPVRDGGEPGKSTGWVPEQSQPGCFPLPTVTIVTRKLGARYARDTPRIPWRS